MQDFPLGTHLVVPRTMYTHHGIYAGNGEVVHYSGLSNGLQAGPVEITSLPAFRGDGEITIRSYDSPKYEGMTVVMRAYSRLGENEYDIHGNNCEHFCTWAITGERVSKQVNSVENIADLAGLDILVAASQIRKHYVQGWNTKEVSKDVAVNAAKLALLASAGPVTVATLGFKLIKYALGRR